MIKYALIITGDEILNCTVKDENSSFLCEELNSLGYYGKEIVFVRDSIEDISFYLKKFLNEMDIVIITGGLGPTVDDITLRSVSQALDLPLILNDEALKMIREKYSSLPIKKEMNVWREKMAYMPLKSKPIKNPVGTAPGMFLRYGKTVFIALPGVPSEMKGMFPSVKEELIKLFGKFFYMERTIFLENIDESSISSLLEDLRKKFPEIYIKSRAGTSGKFGNIAITISTRDVSKEICLLKIDSFLKVFSEEMKKLNISLKI